MSTGEVIIWTTGAMCFAFLVVARASVYWYFKEKQEHLRSMLRGEPRSQNQKGEDE